MQYAAQFCFYGALNDFLPRHKKGAQIHYHFNGLPALKDAVEALGVPHPEVDVVLVHGQPARFMQPLYNNDVVQVYPADQRHHWPPGYSLTPPVREARFVLDVHLGSLARALRLLGFDTSYETDYSDQEIARIAATEDRIALTRDINLLKQKTIVHGYWLRSQHLLEQLREVLLHYQLSTFSPFNRCLACNGKIVPADKTAIEHLLPPNTVRYFNEFYQCLQCRRVYWKGSHYERMLRFIEQVKEDVKRSEE